MLDRRFNAARVAIVVGLSVASLSSPRAVIRPATGLWKVQAGEPAITRSARAVDTGAVQRFVVHEDAPRPRLVLVALAAAVGFTVLFAASVAGGFTHGRWQDFFNHWVYTGGIAVAFGCVAWRAVAVRAERGAWLAIAAGLGCFLLGDLYFNGFLAGLEEPPYPSWADAGWLLFYPFAYVGLVLLIRGRVERLPASSWLEGVIGALALASVAAAVAFDPLVASTEGVFSTIATNLAYPTGDVLLLAFGCAGAALQGWRSGRAWAFSQSGSRAWRLPTRSTWLRPPRVRIGRAAGSMSPGRRRRS